jgi:hypothetical protein
MRVGEFWVIRNRGKVFVTAIGKDAFLAILLRDLRERVYYFDELEEYIA